MKEMLALTFTLYLTYRIEYFTAHCVHKRDSYLPHWVLYSPLCP